MKFKRLRGNAYGILFSFKAVALEYWVDWVVTILTLIHAVKKTEKQTGSQNTFANWRKERAIIAFECTAEHAAIAIMLKK